MPAKNFTFSIDQTNFKCSLLINYKQEQCLNTVAWWKTVYSNRGTKIGKKSQCHKNEEKFHNSNFVKTQLETLRSLTLCAVLGWWLNLPSCRTCRIDRFCGCRAHGCWAGRSWWPARPAARQCRAPTRQWWSGHGSDPTFNATETFTDGLLQFLFLFLFEVHLHNSWKIKSPRTEINIFLNFLAYWWKDPVSDLYK